MAAPAKAATAAAAIVPFIMNTRFSAIRNIKYKKKNAR